MEKECNDRDGERRVRYDYALTPLDRKILECILVDFSEDGGCVLLGPDDAQELEWIAENGAASTAPTGLTYYRETRRFMMENQAAIREHIVDLAKSDGMCDGNGRILGPVGTVMSYRCMEGHDRIELEDAVAMVLYGPVEKMEEGTMGDLRDLVANAIVWGLLEDLARRLSDTRL